MNIENLSTIVALLVALSVAAERLVEIIKGFVPWLEKKKDDESKEGRRKSALQGLAVLAGIGTALLAWPVIKDIVPGSGFWDSIKGVLALGFLASGGSGFWNSIATKEMKNLEEIRNILTSHIDILKSQYKVKEIGIFGSYVRGKQKKKSDIDILVEFKETPDLFEFLDLEEYLDGILMTKVDLVTKKALKPHIGKRILEEVIYL